VNLTVRLYMKPSMADGGRAPVADNILRASYTGDDSNRTISTISACVAIEA